MTPDDWTPPPDAVTGPDQLSEGAYRELSLLEDERIARCWRTSAGFLVMTNLRVIPLWHRAELFAEPEWKEAPSLFFYALAAPRVLLGRFLELSDGDDDAGERLRFLVADPASVAAEIEAARGPGRSEWDRRRARALSQTDLTRTTAAAAPPQVVREIVREVVKVLCRNGGGLVYAGQRRSPLGGA